MKKFGQKVIVLLLSMVMIFAVVGCDGTEVVAKNKITLSNKVISVDVGKSATLTATTEPANLALTWSSSDKTIANYADGKVNGLKKGTATITASNGDANASCVVTVNEVAVIKTTIEISAATLSVTAGETAALNATTTPAGKTIVWTSSDPTVATYADGTVTAINEGTTTITATSDGASKTCVVTVTAAVIQDEIEDDINKTLVGALEEKTLADQDFATDKGIFTGGTYTAGSISLADLEYTFTKVKLPKITKKYSYGNKEEFDGLERNSRNFIRFEAHGTGGVAVYAINAELEMYKIMLDTMLTATSKKYQVQIPSGISDKVTAIVLKNIAPADAGTETFIDSFKISTELDPKNITEYYTDMYEWLSAKDPQQEPAKLSPATGWGSWVGVSRGDLSANCATYLDGFGAALEYEDKGAAINKANAGNAIFSKLIVPQGTIKMTFTIAHVGDPSAYRVQLFDGTTFETLTEGSDKVNSQNVNHADGWKLTSQNYDGTDITELAIDPRHVGKEVMIIFSAKYDNKSGFGTRINNITFSKKAIIVPGDISDGINIGELNGYTAVSASEYNFANDAKGFTLLKGAAVAASGISMAGVALQADCTTNSAIAAKLTVPASFNYLRLSVSCEDSKSADVRIRMIDLKEKKSAIINDWRTITGTSEQIIQISEFPVAFTGTVGFVVETKYTTPATAATLLLKSISFVGRVRDAKGYDLNAMKYVPSTSVTENKIVFSAAQSKYWGAFTANDHANTKVFQNDIWGLQLQGDTVVENNDYSSLIASKVKLPTATQLDVTTLFIGAANLKSYIRVRALNVDGTFTDFVKADFTDANGWFDVNNANRTAQDTWGFKTVNSIDIPADIQGKDVTLVIEYNKAGSTAWNVIINTLLFK